MGQHISGHKVSEFVCVQCRVSMKTIKKVFPLSVMFCMTVTMSNLCLKYVEVSFYQISRSLGIPMIPLIKYPFDGDDNAAI